MLDGRLIFGISPGGLLSDAELFGNLDADRGCVVATNGPDLGVYKSGRNIPRTEVTDVAALNAYQILARRKLVFTRDAFEKFKQLVGADSAAGE